MDAGNNAGLRFALPEIGQNTYYLKLILSVSVLT